MIIIGTRSGTVHIFLNQMRKSCFAFIGRWLFIGLSLSLSIVRQPHPPSGESQHQETFLAPSADKQTHNYDTRALKPPSLPINPEAKGIEP